MSETKDESPNIMYGRLKEAVNISGYSLERAMHEFEWLLDGDRWAKVGEGFDDINDFLKTINLSEFKIAIDQRKQIALKLADLQASQRVTAEALGVANATISRDVDKRVANVTVDEESSTEYQDVTNDSVTNVTPDDKEPEFLNESPEKLVSGRVKEEKKKAAKEERLEAESNKRFEQIKDIDIRGGNFVDALSDVYDIDAIITDPPYPKEFIQCFSDLALFAKEHLKDDGFCVVYSGQYNLPEVIERMSEHLTYVWTFCLYHKGKTQLVNGVNIMCGWKPVLIFSKGRKKMRFSAYDVCISEQYEKHSHEWQQSESGVEKLIEIFSGPSDLIVDPFAGSGTFLKVANDMSRNAIGAEIKKDDN